MQELVAVTFHLPGAVDLTFAIEAPQAVLGLPAFRDGGLQVAQRGRELVARASLGAPESSLSARRPVELTTRPESTCKPCLTLRVRLRYLPKAHRATDLPP